MGKQGLSYSEVEKFEEYMREAINAASMRDERLYRKMSICAREMIFDWRCDNKISDSDGIWFTNMFRAAQYAYSDRDWDVVWVFLTRILAEFRITCKRDN